MVSSVKLPILKKGEYILWTMKMEQSPSCNYTANIGKNKRKKAKSTLLMAIPDEHLARFHGIKDAKTLWAAIKTKFGEGQDKRYDRFQRLLSLLEIHGAESINCTNELNAAYSVSTATCHNKEDLEQIDQDDLEEMDLKWQVAMLSIRVKFGVLIVIEEGTLPGIINHPGIQGTRVEMLEMQDKKEKIMVKDLQKRRMNKHCLSHLIKDCTFHEDRMAKKSVLPTNVGKETGHRKSRPVWNNVQRINHQNKFAPTAVFIRYGRIPVSAAKPKAAVSTSVAKPINTTRPKQVTVVKGNGVTTVKTSTGYVWRPRMNAIDQLSNDNRWICTHGHPQQALKNKEIVDNECSRHMTRNKAYLFDYQEIHDGGFVAFGLSRVSEASMNLAMRLMINIRFLMDLKFVDEHDMVACLEKTEENVEFQQIQIHTIVDEKAVVISESSVRSDFFFKDKDGKFTPLFDSMLVQNQAPKGEDIEADEHVHQEGGDSVERAITIDVSLVAVQDTDNIVKTQSTAMSIDIIS
nr:hypothetical protein [Tanacetum cinerariifolium]